MTTLYILGVVITWVTFYATSFFVIGKDWQNGDRVFAFLFGGALGSLWPLVGCAALVFYAGYFIFKYPIRYILEAFEKLLTTIKRKVQA